VSGTFTTQRRPPGDRFIGAIRSTGVLPSPFTEAGKVRLLSPSAANPSRLGDNPPVAPTATPLRTGDPSGYLSDHLAPAIMNPHGECDWGAGCLLDSEPSGFAVVPSRSRDHEPSW